MAKRSRGSARPGQLAPRRSAGPRPTTRPASSAPGSAQTPSTAKPPSGSLTQDEEARAAALEAQIVAQEREAEAARKSRSRGRGAGALVAAGPRGESLIAVKGTQEYAYVRKDLRRIAAVGGTLTGLLVALWIVLEVFGVFRI